MDVEIRRKAWRNPDAPPAGVDVMGHAPPGIADVDAVTGLMDFRSLLHLLERIDKKPSPEGQTFALFYVDLDRFFRVNGSLSHDIGNRVLVEIAGRLVEWLGGCEGGLTRMGADHFVILRVGRWSDESVERAVHDLKEILGRAVNEGNLELHFNASIGVALRDPALRHGACSYIRDANIAAVNAKRQGTAAAVRFAPAMHQQLSERLVLENDLRGALRRREVRAAYQPIVSLQSGKPMGLEALARWRRAERDEVSPGQFIPLAEESGLIEPLGELMLELSLANLRALAQRGGHESIESVSVNVSRRQLFGCGLVKTVERFLARSGVAPQSLQLEITETVVMGDVEHAGRVLKELKALGVKLALDDFGVGQSSLHCIRKFPVDVLKVDRSFLQGMADLRDLAAVLNAVITLAHNLGMQVVAEGIETKDQLTLLQALDCDLGQGFYFSAAVEAEELGQMRQAWNSQIN